MDNLWLPIVVIVVLTLANGLFAASEIAIVSARRGRLQRRADAGSRNARIALELADEPNRFLATVQVGITLIGTFAGAYGGDALADPLAALMAPYVGGAAETMALALVVLVITYLSLILGELVPKRLALQHAEAIASFAAPLMRFLSRAAAPAVWLLSASTQAVLTMLGRANAPEEQVTEDDILSLVREGTEDGAVATSEEELIRRVFEWSDATARSIMTPRTEMVSVTIETPLQQVAQAVVESGYSRIPVWDEARNAIAGIVYAKDLLGLLKASKADTAAGRRLPGVLRPPLYVLEHQRIPVVLQQLKQARTHLALVLDEYGQVEGLVTLEDVLEELTGAIPDENDDGDQMVVERPDGSLLVDGRLSYADAEKRIGFPSRATLDDLPEFDTVAGLVLAILEHIPGVGETLSWRDWHFEVVDLDKVRIDKLLIRRLTPVDAFSQNEAALASGAARPPSGG